jgi:hypothetical protein
MDISMFGFFYDLAQYANENWRGKFSPREVAEHAYIYTMEMEHSIMHDEPSHTIQDLKDQLYEDMRNGSVRAKELYERIEDYEEVM